MSMKLMYGEEAFRADPTPKLVVDREFMIRAANPARSKVTGREESELISQYIFDAFPNNPGDPTADGVERLQASFEQVLRTRSPHHMVIQRYDIPDPLAPGEFMHRHWVPVNSPIWDGDEVVGIVHQVNDVTDLRANALSAMEQYRDLLANTEMISQEAEKYQAMIAAFTDGMVNYNALADEVVQLREALHTRGTIEQAKGMLMATRNCGPDEAFRILAKMSQDTNVRLADVAAALIYQFRTSK